MSSGTGQTARFGAPASHFPAAWATSQAALAERYLEEGLRRDEHPAITFIDGPAGHRPRVAGTGLDVWEVVETFRNADGSIDDTAAYLGIPARLVREAIRYYADYAAEIDAWIQRMHGISDREEEAARRLRAVLESDVRMPTQDSGSF